MPSPTSCLPERRAPSSKVTPAQPAQRAGTASTGQESKASRVSQDHKASPDHRVSPDSRVTKGCKGCKGCLVYHRHPFRSEVVVPDTTTVVNMPVIDAAAAHAQVTHNERRRRPTAMPPNAGSGPQPAIAERSCLRDEIARDEFG